MKVENSIKEKKISAKAKGYLIFKLHNVKHVSYLGTFLIFENVEWAQGVADKC